MKTKETIVVTVFYCDVCGAKCESGMTTFEFEQAGKEDQHACAGADESLARCKDVLEKRIVAECLKNRRASKAHK
jgi:hypothetical protein